VVGEKSRSLAAAKPIRGARATDGVSRDEADAGYAMVPVTIDGIPDQQIASSLLRLAVDPTHRACLYDALGGFCHQSRNVLNSLKLSLYLAKRSATPDLCARWSELEPHYLELEQFIERLQFIIRPMELNCVCLPLSLLIEERTDKWSAEMGTHGRRLEFVPPVNSSNVKYDPSWLGHALDALVAWRAEAKRGSSVAQLRWGVDHGASKLEWLEDSIGGADRRLDRPDSLALPLVGRVVSAHGGTLSVDVRDGLQVCLRWPVDAKPQPDEH
jgi:hypothetical protein